MDSRIKLINAFRVYKQANRQRSCILNGVEICHVSLSFLGLGRLFSSWGFKNVSASAYKRCPLTGDYKIVWFQKISIPPPPRKVTGNSEGEGGSKAEISEGSGGFIGSSFSRG